MSSTAETHVQSGVSAFKIPNCHPTASSSKDATALPKKTDRSISREKSQYFGRVNVASTICF